jgi:hypothetical protein
MGIKMTNQVYQFRINLKEISPMVWRRFLIQDDRTLADLHYVIQIIMGWTDYHLNEFSIHGKRYTITNNIGMASPNGNFAEEIELQDLRLRLNKKFLYAYDFTAGWEFEIRLEKILASNEKKTYPLCISGSGASPDEECGGPKRFEFLKNEWFFKAYEELGELLKTLESKLENSDKESLEKGFDISRLREIDYWLNIDKYKRKQVNQYLKLYSKNDARWREAFDEVLYL